MIDLLSDIDRKALLELARRALDARVKRERAPAVACAGTLALRRAAFVSIHRGGELRGCLGRLTLDAPLGQTVVHLAEVVADSDPRFAAVTVTELPHLQIEISVLTPPRRIASADEIEVGRHGLIVEDGSARGLLLPQVAAERGWPSDTFLEQTCLKAGLPRDAWLKGAHVLVFEAQVFGEGQRAGTAVI